MRAALVELNMLLAAQSPAAWQRPCSAGTLCDYFAGRWSLRKEMSYVRGGISGTFSGDACFHRMGDEWLAYAEQGKATLGEEGSKPQIFEASRRLLYDCSQPAGRVECYFDEATDRTPAGVREGAKFFHEIQLPMAADAVPPFEHPCGPDLYRGKLIFAVRAHHAAISCSSDGSATCPFSRFAGRRLLPLRLGRDRPAEGGVDQQPLRARRIVSFSASSVVLLCHFYRACQSAARARARVDRGVDTKSPRHAANLRSTTFASL